MGKRAPNLLNPRKLSYDYVLESTGEKNLAEYENIDKQADLLNPKDRALYQQMKLGTLREFHFLKHILECYSSQKPKAKMLSLFAISAYALLFLDKVPDYAIFSEIKKIAEFLHLSESEMKYLHACLKRVEREKDFWLKKKKTALENNRKTENDLILMSLHDSILDTIALGVGRDKAIDCYVAMKNPIKIMGFKMFEEINNPIQSKLEVLLEEIAVEDLAEDKLVVQAEVSRFVSNRFAGLVEGCQNQDKISVLEIATGKGGKFFSTIDMLYRKNPKILSKLTWLATDSSQGQLDIFKKAVVQKLRKTEVDLKVKRVDYVSHEIREEKKYDLIFIDAPCSGLGTLSKHPEIGLFFKAEFLNLVDSCVETQKYMLNAAAAQLKSGGKILYSVCSLTRQETTDVERFATSELGLKRVEAKLFIPGFDPAPESEGFYYTILCA